MSKLMERVLKAAADALEHLNPEMIGRNNTTDNTYKLMIKQHWNTGISYLCITKLKNFRKYRGSGIRWRHLLKSDPSAIYTHLLFSTDGYEEFTAACMYYSNVLDVKNSSLFANLIEESGYTYDPHKVKSYNSEAARAGGIIGGKLVTENKLGIHDPKYKDKRTEWAIAGASALNESGNRSGMFSKEWQDNNKERAHEICSTGGKIGGKITGELLWWNDGIKNCKSVECPGDNWKRGMLSSEKKSAALKNNISFIHSTSGTVCINNGSKNKMIKPEELDEYVKNGWIKGRIKRSAKNV